MKTFFNRIGIALIFFILGAWSGHKATRLYDSFLKPGPLTTLDQNPSKSFGVFNLPLTSPFALPLSGFELNTHEDDHFIYFEIPTQDMDVDNLQVEVQGPMLHIQGNLVRKDENSSFQSSFDQSFPLPDRAAPETYTVEKLDDKILIKFQKIGA